jgi:hypothetical protein
VAERIEGKVAQIMTAQDLVINRGSLDGVEIGQRYAILSPKGQDIKDPDTNEVLDSVELAKTFVKIVSVRPRIAVGRTFRTIKGSRGALNMSAIFNGSEDRQETLRTAEHRAQQDLSAEESYVKIGDPAVQVLGKSFPAVETDIYDR